MDIDTEVNNNFIKKTNKIYPIYHMINRPYIISKAESRIKNDLVVFQNKRLTTNRFKINISPYSQCANGKDFIMYIEFENLFKLQIIFLEDYPFVPPIITYVKGQYLEYLFDMENNLKLSCLKQEKWSPVLDLNSIIYSIELKIDEINPILPTKIKKRNYFEYQKIHNFDNLYMLSTHQMKRLKIY